MANISINNLTLEDVTRDDDSFETQRSAASGSASRRNTRLQMLLNSQTWKGIYDVREAGIVGDSTDETSKLNTAFTTAANENRFLWIPPKFSIGVSSTVSVTAPILGGSHGVGLKPSGFASIVNVGINNIYTPMLEVDTVTNTNMMRFFAMRGLTLNGRNSTSGSLRCTGFNVKGGRATPGDFNSNIRCLTYYLLQHSQISDCYGFGLRVVGFIGLLENMFGNNNGINRLILANAVQIIGGEWVPCRDVVGPMTGVNSWGLQFVASDGKSITTEEGTHVVYLNTTVESGGVCNGIAIGENLSAVTLNSVYLEGFDGDTSTVCYGLDVGSIGRSEDPDSSTYALLAASGNQANSTRGVTLINTGLGGRSYYTLAGGRVRFNNVRGVQFIGETKLSAGQLEFTDKCFNVTGLPTGVNTQNDAHYYRDSWFVDSSGLVGRPCKNLILNPNGAGGMRGFRDVYDNASGRITFAEDSTLIRLNTSLSVTHSGAAVPGLNYDAEYVIAYVHGGTQNLRKALIGFSCWVFIPDNDNYGVTKPLGPRIGISYESDTSNGGGTWVRDNSKALATHYSYQDGAGVWQVTQFATVNRWNLFRCWAMLPNLPIRNLGLLIQPLWTNSSPALANPLGSAILRLSDMIMAVRPGNIETMASGIWTFDEAAGLVLPGGAIETSGTGAPSSSAIYHKAGDRHRHTTPVAGGFLGWVATASGYGAAANWKQFGLIEL